MKREPGFYRAGAWACAIGVALVAQQFLYWGWLHAGLVLYAFAGVWGIVACRCLPLPSLSVAKTGTWTWNGNRWMCGAGVFLVAGTAATTPIDGMMPGLVMWLAGLVLMGACGYRAYGEDLKSIPVPTWLILAGLTGYASILAFYDLATLPFTVHGDEGMVGIHARAVAQGQPDSFFSTSWYNLPQFFFRYPRWGYG